MPELNIQFHLTKYTHMYYFSDINQFDFLIHFLIEGNEIHMLGIWTDIHVIR